MKTFILCLFTAILSMSLEAQGDLRCRPAGIPRVERVQQSDPDFYGKRIAEMLHVFVGNEQGNVMRKSGAKEQMDSIVCETVYSGKDYFKYDGDGNARELVSQQWYPILNKMVQAKREYQYDANGRITENKDLRWDTVTNDWVDQSRITYYYSTNYLSEQMVQIWDRVKNNWKNGWKDSYSYRPSGNIFVHHTFFWDTATSDWEQYKKYEHGYDINENLRQIRELYWISSRNQWGSSYYEEYTYSGDTQYTKINYHWDPRTVRYETPYKGVFSLSLGRLSQLLEYGRDMTNTFWVESSKTNYSYDPNGNISSILWSEWDGSTWQTVEKLEISYDLSVPIEDVYFKFKVGKNLIQIEEFAENKLLSLEYFQHVNGNWQGKYKETFYYSPFTGGNGIIDAKRTAVKVYPNPSSNHITFDLPESAGETEVIIMNMNGRVVLQQNLNAHNKEINVSQLSKGIYLYKLIGAEVNTGKFVVE